MKGAFDVAVVGSGFGGSLAALLARRVGRTVVLIERASHPRFAIGESSSPLANLLLEELADRYGLPRIKPLSAWGTWQRHYPELGCGLKRGFTFYGHRPGEPFAADPQRRDQLLVAASPNDEVADTHWYRPDFDHFLAREAASEGAEYFDRTKVTRLSPAPDGFSIEAERLGHPVTINARFLVDASGPGGFLHRALGLAPSAFPGLPQTEGLYTHFEGVRRLDGMGVLASREPPPYPVDDAAVHHVFEGGWIWVLRFNNGITSAGVAATPKLAGELDLREGAAGWARLLERLPTVRDQFSDALPVLPFVHRAALPFRSSAAAGPGWALIPSAAAFVDPILSTGFPLTLLGLERLAEAWKTSWGRPAFAKKLESYEARTLFEAETAALLVAALYANFGDFPVFAALTHLYFAAASFAEAARRLGKPALAGSFLSGDHAVFGPALRSSCRMALSADGRKRDAVLDSVRRAIEPLDVVGLGNPSRRNWHPVEAADLLDGAHKLGATAGEVRELLRRSGLPAPSEPGAGNVRPDLHVPCADRENLRD